MASGVMLTSGWKYLRFVAALQEVLSGDSNGLRARLTSGFKLLAAKFPRTANRPQPTHSGSSFRDEVRSTFKAVAGALRSGGVIRSAHAKPLEQRSLACQGEFSLALNSALSVPKPILV
jgi:hypothetical protein